jgi:Protein of unknown function (DUF2889)
MTIECRWLDPAGSYERTVTGWVDVLDDSLLQLSARLTDRLADLEVSLVAEPSPSYQLTMASATARSESTRLAGGPLLEAFPGIGRLRMASGFRRQVAATLGEHPLAGHVLDAAIEAARLSRQVTRIDVPGPGRPGPAEFHQLDLDAWPELLDLCFTYRTETRALFAERSVRTPASIDMYTAPPGRKLVFHRYKRSHVVRSGSTLELYQSMFDHVHGFELWYDVDAESHEILRARVLTPRLPYMGICDEPQQRARDMVGVKLGADWTETVRPRLGGRRGCFQLTDLTSDLCRLLIFG